MVDAGSDGTKKIRGPLAAEPAGRLVLRCVEGADVGVTVELDPEEPCRLLLGQSAACEVRLTDRRVSRRHAAVQYDGAHVRLTDLASTNGTLVDGVSIVEAFLKGGETVRLGGTSFLVERKTRKRTAKAPSPEKQVRFGRLLGASDAMRHVYRLCERLATANATVVIEGETGTGKEVLAEALHEEGPRSGGPFVVFDCAAHAAGQAELALFGCEGGYAAALPLGQLGAFEEAAQGTLLIDEIADLEQPLQAKLLRVLERGEIRRLGSSKNTAVDVRVLTSTRRDLDREVAAGRFREDLFLRLAVARVELPPLRRRDGDVTLLADHFWSTLGGGREGISFETLQRLEDDAWPGNVRELFNVVARLVALGPLASAEPKRPAPADEAAEFLEQVLDLNMPLAPARQKVVEEFERRYVARIVAEHGGNIGKAAAAAGIARRYFQLLRAKARAT